MNPSHIHADVMHCLAAAIPTPPSHEGIVQLPLIQADEKRK
jgi:hypothetical protein